MAHALEKKYPKVEQSWAWFWVFPSPASEVDPCSGVSTKMIYAPVRKATDQTEALEVRSTPLPRSNVRFWPEAVVRNLQR